MTIKRLFSGTLFVLLLAFLAAAQQKQASLPPAGRILLGHLANGATVTFVRTGSDEWGIDVSGTAVSRLKQPKPAQVEIYRKEDDVTDIAASYRSVQKKPGEIFATSTVEPAGGAAFTFVDHWKITGDVLILSRTVTVTKEEKDAGFDSAIRLLTEPEISWSDLDYFAPGVIYGDPTYDGDNSPGGVLNYRAKRFALREDQLSAPLFALSFRDGRWAAAMDMSPRGDTTWAESSAAATTPVIDEHIQFGALGAQESSDGGVEFGFWFPGTTHEFTRGFQTPPTPVVRRRYHPVKPGFSQSYQVGFRFGQGASFPAMVRDSWRWAWETLKPPPMKLDLDVVRRVLTTHLDNHVLTVDDRSLAFLSSSTQSQGIPVPTAIGVDIAIPSRYHPACRPMCRSRPMN